MGDIPVLLCLNINKLDFSMTDLLANGILYEKFIKKDHVEFYNQLKRLKVLKDFKLEVTIQIKLSGVEKKFVHDYLSSDTVKIGSIKKNSAHMALLVLLYNL